MSSTAQVASLLANRTVESGIDAKIGAAIGNKKCFMPTQLAIETVRACNAKCIMCPSETMKRPKGVMSTAVHETILSKISKWGAPISLITHAGLGEPLLDKMLEERIRREKEVFPNAQVIVYTNGSLLDEKRAAKLIISGVNVVSVSINGLRKETYEAVMQLPRDKTYHNVEALCQLKQETGSKVDICVSLVKTDLCSQQEIEEYRHYWQAKHVKVIIPPWISWGNLLKHNIQKPQHSCFYIWKTMMIDYDGTVKLCCEDYDSRYPLGNIMTQEPSEIFNSPNMQRLRSNQLNGDFSWLPMCRNCTETFEPTVDFWNSTPVLCEDNSKQTCPGSQSPKPHNQVQTERVGAAVSKTVVPKQKQQMISVLDTSMCDNNLGNQIIMDSVDKYLRRIFPSEFFIKLPYLDNLGREAVKYIQASAVTFLGGTNALSSEMEKYKQIGIDSTNYEQIQNIVLMGVGWWQYQGAVNSYTQQILRHCLHPDLYHSVRDSYTKDKLSSLGIGNVLVTGCPTLWPLTEDHCRRIRRTKSENVLLTFTNYSQDKSDLDLFNIIQSRYKNIFVWVQGPEDLDYAKQFSDKINILPPRLDALDELLSSDIELDYVGTRCHAGIRAMQFLRRSIIIGVDNRAIEMQKDFNLPVLSRMNLSALPKIIDDEFEIKLNIPFDVIRRWGYQFSADFRLEADTPDNAAAAKKGRPEYVNTNQKNHDSSSVLQTGMKDRVEQKIYAGVAMQSNCPSKEYQRENETNPNIVWLRPRVDPNGRVFEKDGRIFRAMKKTPDYYQRLLAIIHSNKILRETIINTRLCDEILPKYNSILEHKKINPFTSPGDWSYSMFKDALIAHLRVHIELLSHGYTLQDGHLWNVSFDGSSPKYIDFGSIIEYRDNILASKKEYLHFCITPLLLMTLGYFDKTRVYLRVSTNLYLAEEDVYGYINKHKESLAVKQYCEIINILGQTATGTSEYKAQLSRICEIVEAVNYESKSIWSVYHKGEEGGQFHNKIAELENFLKSKNNLDVLDIGCASGFYSLLAAQYGHRVVATEIDMPALDYTYNKAKAKNYNVTPILRNLMEVKADLSGNKFDVVIANALIHHLAFTQRMSMEEIVEKLSEYCKQYLFVEYINENDPFVKKHINDYQFEYSYDKLKSSLETRFDIVNVFPSSSDKRQLVLCKIKDKTLLSSPDFKCSLSPVSRKFGFDRGTPIDRIFMDQFLHQNREFIRGTVLEIAEDTYTKKFGSGVTSVDILHATAGNRKATLVGNLETGENIPENRYDCIILTQTLHVIYDYRLVIRNCFKALKKDGVLLLTAPGISQISRYDMDRWGDYWRFTSLSLKKILGEQFGQENVDVRNFGNYHLAVEFLNGRSAQEIPAEVFEVTDDDYQLLLGVTAVRKACTAMTGSFQSDRIAMSASRSACTDKIVSCEGPAVLKNPLILLYHRVADDEIDSQLLSVSPVHFEEHLRELKDRYRVVSLRQLLGEFQQNINNSNTVALTFDDGYLDNLTQALPLLEKYGIHATIFITATNVEQSRGFWWDRLEYLFLGNHNLPESLDLNDNDTNYTWPLRTARQKLAAYDQIAKLLKNKLASEIEEFVRELFRWARIPEDMAVVKPVLNIPQLRQLSQSPYIEIGSHTLTHNRLSILSVEQQKIEMVESRKKLESWIGKPVTILSYPYGTKADIDAQTRDLSRQAGYQYALANIQGSVLPGTDLLAISRRLVRNWAGPLFAEWMRSEHKEILEKQTLDQRVETIVQIVSTELRNVQRMGCSVVEQGIRK